MTQHYYLLDTLVILLFSVYTLTLVVLNKTRQLYLGFHQEIHNCVAIAQDHQGYEVLPQHINCTTEKGLFYVKF